MTICLHLPLNHKSLSISLHEPSVHRPWPMGDGSYGCTARPVVVRPGRWVVTGDHHATTTRRRRTRRLRRRHDATPLSHSQPRRDPVVTRFSVRAARDAAALDGPRRGGHRVPAPGHDPNRLAGGSFYARSLAPLTGRPRIVRSARLPSLTGGVHGRWDYRVIEVPGATATSQTVLEGF